MQNEYMETVRQMILANENLRDKILNDWNIDEENNKIINIQLFFLTFSLFSDYFKRLDIYDEWKELFEKQDYYIQGDKIISGDLEISFELIEMTFIETLLKYRENRSPKVLQFNTSKVKENKSEKKTINMNYNEEIKPIYFISQVNLKKTRQQEREEQAIRILNTYKLDREGIASSYLYGLKDSFRAVAYDSIVALYNKLKKSRKDKMFKSNLPLIDSTSNSNKYYQELIYMLLNFYSMQVYARDKEVIDYSPLIMQGIDVDANHYRYDNTWKEFEKRIDEINKIIDNCMIFIRSRKVRESEKRKVRFRINQLEYQKREIENKYMYEMVSQSDMHEVYDEEMDESFYASSMLNKHILYNIENAIRNGHVRIENDKLVFYSVVGDEVDFILNLYNYEMMNVFDIDNMLDSLVRVDKKERMLNNY